MYAQSSVKVMLAAPPAGTTVPYVVSFSVGSDSINYPVQAVIQSSTGAMSAGIPGVMTPAGAPFSVYVPVGSQFVSLSLVSGGQPVGGPIQSQAKCGGVSIQQVSK